jgi:hypothetical protein
MKQTFLDQQFFIFACLCLSVLRIYLEVISFDFAKLPLSKSMGVDRQQKFHKYGFYVSVGYLVLFAPEYLLL